MRRIHPTALVRTERDRPGRILGTLVLVAAVLTGLLCLATAPAAQAHDVLISTTPGDGAAVGQTPSQVVLTFNDSAIATGTVVRVTGPTGDVSVGSPRLTGHSVTQLIEPDAPAGRYTVDWRVTSVDGHPVTGTFSFTSTAAGAGTAEPPSATARPAAPAPAASDGSGGTFWLYVGIVAVVVLAAGLLTTRRRPRR